MYKSSHITNMDRRWNLLTYSLVLHKYNVKPNLIHLNYDSITWIPYTTIRYSGGDLVGSWRASDIHTCSCRYFAGAAVPCFLCYLAFPLPNTEPIFPSQHTNYPWRQKQRQEQDLYCCHTTNILWKNNEKNLRVGTGKVDTQVCGHCIKLDGFINSHRPTKLRSA